MITKNFSNSLLLIVFLLGSCQNVTPNNIKQPDPPEAIQAFDALAKVNSRVEVGVNFTKYIDLLSDAKFALEKYQALPNSDPEKIKLLKTSLVAHVNAVDFWDCKIRMPSSGTLAQCQTQKIETISINYPSVDKYRKTLSGGNGSIYNDIDNNQVLSLLWIEAKQSLDKARKD
jgi:hypothetical protein